MLVNNNISPLPFYERLNQQHHNKSYAFGKVYPLIIYSNIIIPFQVCLDRTVTGIKSVNLVDFNTKVITDITGNMLDNGLSIKRYLAFSVLRYPGTMPITALKFEGQYYLDIELSNSKHIYSDIFTSTNDISKYIKLEYSNPYSFELKNGAVDFSDNFKFVCYICSEIGKPEYKFEEEGSDRLGYFYVESQVSKKIYKFVFLAPEYLCDALRIVRLCSDKVLYSAEQTYELSTFSIEPKWEEQGDVATVEAEFETDTVIANIGGYRPEPIGDFNDDYDHDFYEQSMSPIDITFSINSNKKFVDIVASKAVKSDVVVKVMYQYDGSISGAGSINNYKLQAGTDKVSVDTEIGDGNSITRLYDASILSKGDNDKTEYNAKIQ